MTNAQRSCTVSINILRK